MNFASLFGTRKPVVALKLGAVVYFKDHGLSSRYGVVSEYQGRHYKEGREVEAYNVKYIDPNTGLPMVCPDNRCKGESTCPICSRSAMGDMLMEFTNADAAYYVSVGMIHPSLIRN